MCTFWHINDKLFQSNLSLNNTFTCSLPGLCKCLRLKYFQQIISLSCLECCRIYLSLNSLSNQKYSAYLWWKALTLIHIYIYYLSFFSWFKILYIWIICSWKQQITLIPSFSTGPIHLENPLNKLPKISIF